MKGRELSWRGASKNNSPYESVFAEVYDMMYINEYRKFFERSRNGERRFSTSRR